MRYETIQNRTSYPHRSSPPNSKIARSSRLSRGTSPLREALSTAQLLQHAAAGEAIPCSKSTHLLAGARCDLMPALRKEPGQPHEESAVRALAPRQHEKHRTARQFVGDRVVPGPEPEETRGDECDVVKSDARPSE